MRLNEIRHDVMGVVIDDKLNFLTNQNKKKKLNQTLAE